MYEDFDLFTTGKRQIFTLKLVQNLKLNENLYGITLIRLILNLLVLYAQLWKKQQFCVYEMATPIQNS